VKQEPERRDDDAVVEEHPKAFHTVDIMSDPPVALQVIPGNENKRVH
jgi:hypothetical protein